LPLSYGGTANSVSNVVRVHRNTVIAFKTRVYLQMNNYSAALTEGNKIVSTTSPFISSTGVVYGLASTFSSIFVPPYSTSESVFSIAFTSTELPGTQNGLAVYYTIAPAGNQEYAINTNSPNWTNLTDFPVTDARRLLIRTATVGGVLYTFINKYPLSPNTDYAPIMRYAEVLLNVAEAEAKTNGVNTRAVALLNAVHRRSETTKTYAAADFANADAFVTQLLKERNMEFMGEGIRVMDILRKVQPFPAKASTVSTASAVQPNDPAYVWPIPQSEMATNTLIVQN
jgi:starch-binding outer membrane protein, SusD/RagB family